MNDQTTRPEQVVRAAVSRARSGFEDKLEDLSSAVMIKAVLIGIFGICALLWPATSVRILIFVVAVLFIIDGIAGLYGAWRVNERGGYLGQGILSLAVSGILLFWPDATFRLLLQLIGVWAILHCVALLFSLRELPKENTFRSTQRSVGICLAVIGAALLLWPNVGVVTLSWVIGVAALLMSAVLFWLAQRMKGLRQRVGSDPLA